MIAPMNPSPHQSREMPLQRQQLDESPHVETPPSEKNHFHETVARHPYIALAAAALAGVALGCAVKRGFGRRA